MTYQLNRVKANTKFEINISQIIKDKKTIAMKTKTLSKISINGVSYFMYPV